MGPVCNTWPLQRNTLMIHWCCTNAVVWNAHGNISYLKSTSKEFRICTYIIWESISLTTFNEFLFHKCVCIYDMLRYWCLMGNWVDYCILCGITLQGISGVDISYIHLRMSSALTVTVLVNARFALKRYIHMHTKPRDEIATSNLPVLMFTQHLHGQNIDMTAIVSLCVC